MAWVAWKKFLHKLSSKDGKLKSSLGRWIQPNPTRQFEAYISPDNKLRMRNKLGQWNFFELEKIPRKSRTYLTWTCHTTHELSALDTPTDVLHVSSTRISVANPSAWIHQETPAPPDTSKWYVTKSRHSAQLTGKVTLIMPDKEIQA
jgi:hypothetical protein